MFTCYLSATLQEESAIQPLAIKTNHEGLEDPKEIFAGGIPLRGSKGSPKPFL